MNEWLLVIAVFLAASILGVGLPLIYMSGRAHIDKALDDTRLRLLHDAQDWSETQERIREQQTEQITALQKALQIERDSRMSLEGRIYIEMNYAKRFKDQVEHLTAQVARLEADRDLMNEQLTRYQTSSEVYRATLVVLLLQMQQHRIRPNINAGLLDVVRKDSERDEKARRLLELVEEYLKGD